MAFCKTSVILIRPFLETHLNQWAPKIIQTSSLSKQNK